MYRKPSSSWQCQLGSEEESMTNLVLLVYGAHQRGGRRQHLVDKDEDGLLGRQLDALADDVDELADGQVGGDEVLLLVDGGNVRLFNLLADDLAALDAIKVEGRTYGNAVGVLLANALGFCLALLERVLVLELGVHGGQQGTAGAELGARR